jgi:hypothetical protein
MAKKFPVRHTKMKRSQIEADEIKELESKIADLDPAQITSKPLSASVTTGESCCRH